MTTMSFEYLNHRGKQELRTVDVECLEYFSNPAFGYQAGWFISGRCHTKNARRSFALSRIIIPEDPSPARIPIKFPIG